VPEGAATRHIVEREDFLHAAVAVGGDDEHEALCVGRRGLGHAEDHVVVKLALRPVGDQIVSAEATLNLVEQGAEDEAAGEATESSTE
jgi:dihydroxyacetone kinase